MYFYNRQLGEAGPVEPVEPTVGDIRSLTDVDVTASPNMGPQYLGNISVKVSKTQIQTIDGVVTTVASSYSDADPNNIVSKFGARWDDRTYYRRNRS